MAEQTAVDWLKNNLPSLFQDDSNGFYADLFNKAKEMELEQMRLSFHCGVFSIVKDEDERYLDGGLPYKGDPDFDEFMAEFYNA